MARYNQTEFAQACGIKKNAVAVYVSRGNIIIKDGIIDDRVKKNAEFKAKWRDKKGLDNVSNKRSNVPSHGKITREPEPPQEIDPHGLLAMEKRQKMLNLERTEEEILSKRVKNEQSAGKTLPTDLVNALFFQYSKSITLSFNNAANNFLILISKKFGITLAQAAELRADLRSMINEAVEDAHTNSKKQLKNMQAEYAVQRGIGEKK